MIFVSFILFRGNLMYKKLICQFFGARMNSFNIEMLRMHFSPRSPDYGSVYLQNSCFPRDWLARQYFPSRRTNREWNYCSYLQSRNQRLAPAIGRVFFQLCPVTFLINFHRTNTFATPVAGNELDEAYIVFYFLTRLR